MVRSPTCKNWTSTIASVVNVHLRKLQIDHCFVWVDHEMVEQGGQVNSADTVSYTHLTLPTICSV
eukprot:3432922-Rhodomonas_salina.1